jgi:hypothetical protein
MLRLFLWPLHRRLTSAGHQAWQEGFFLLVVWAVALPGVAICCKLC